MQSDVNRETLAKLEREKRKLETGYEDDYGPDGTGFDGDDDAGNDGNAMSIEDDEDIAEILQDEISRFEIPTSRCVNSPVILLTFSVSSVSVQPTMARYSLLAPAQEHDTSSMGPSSAGRH